MLASRALIQHALPVSLGLFRVHGHRGGSICAERAFPPQWLGAFSARARHAAACFGVTNPAVSRLSGGHGAIWRRARTCVDFVLFWATLLFHKKVAKPHIYIYIYIYAGHSRSIGSRISDQTTYIYIQGIGRGIGLL